MHLEALQRVDPELAMLLIEEQRRQMEGLELIPSENLVEQAILEALGSVPTNKYAEGYPGRRYYGGNEVIDKIESLAISRVKKLFGAQHANVQPYSGSPANLAAYLAVMRPGDAFMAMKLTEGGHLSHGHPVSYTGKLFKPVHYGVDRETEMLDYDVILKQAKETKPKVIVAGYTAYPREVDFKAFREICDTVGAVAMADISHISGLCATGIHQNPVPSFDIVMTTTHKMLRGPRGAVIMCKEELAEKVDKAVFPGMQGGPHENTIAAMAVCFKRAMDADYHDYVEQIVKNAKTLAEELMALGARLVTGGTDTHLMLVDVTPYGITGGEAQEMLEQAGIYCNKNTIPFDKRSPFNPSGIRLGTPVLTTRGMKEGEMKEVAAYIHRVLSSRGDGRVIEEVRAQVRELCKGFPFYS
jgi:glycine hydroxymethyltransferase